MNNYPLLYILMRSDMVSLNAGKAMAQAAHASNNFMGEMAILGDLPKSFETWCNQAKGQYFGTTIVLDIGCEDSLFGKLAEIAASSAFRNREIYAGIIEDTTYPISDGKVTHFLPINTCGWVFGYKETLSPFLKDLSLYP